MSIKTADKSDPRGTDREPTDDAPFLYTLQSSDKRGRAQTVLFEGADSGYAEGRWYASTIAIPEADWR